MGAGGRCRRRCRRRAREHMAWHRHMAATTVQQRSFPLPLLVSESNEALIGEYFVYYCVHLLPPSKESTSTYIPETHLDIGQVAILAVGRRTAHRSKGRVGNDKSSPLRNSANLQQKPCPNNPPAQVPAPANSSKQPTTCHLWAYPP